MLVITLIYTCLHLSCCVLTKEWHRSRVTLRFYPNGCGVQNQTPCPNRTLYLGFVGVHGCLCQVSETSHGWLLLTIIGQPSTQLTQPRQPPTLTRPRPRPPRGQPQPNDDAVVTGSGPLAILFQWQSYSCKETDHFSLCLNTNLDLYLPCAAMAYSQQVGFVSTQGFSDNPWSVQVDMYPYLWCAWI